MRSIEHLVYHVRHVGSNIHHDCKIEEDVFHMIEQVKVDKYPEVPS